MVTDCHAGQVFLLDYTGMGLKIPEMVKERLVVVVSPRSINVDNGLATVVPLSITAPRARQNHVVPLSKDYAWIKGRPQLWAKTDLIYTPALERLRFVDRVEVADRPPTNHNPVPQISHADLKNIRLGMAHAVGLNEYLLHGEKRGFSSFLTERYKKLLKRLSKKH